MNSTTIIGGSTSKLLAKRISKKLNAKYVDVKIRNFPDGENKFTIKNLVKSKKIIIVQSTSPPVDSNIVQLLCLIHKAREMSNQVYVVMPYFGYARQDKEFLSGEIVTSSVIASLIELVGARKLFVIDIHSEFVLDFFKIPVVNLSAVSLLANHLKKIKMRDSIAVSTDLFWESHTKELAKILNIKYVTINKQRDRKTGKLKIIPSDLKDVKNRDVFLVDDMISSGNSMVIAAKILKKNGCKRIIAVCTHSLLVGNAESNLKKAGISTIISTNTIREKTNTLDASDLIVDKIKD